nr:hypothetical protein [Candidatus Gracilibacteria bacterium]
IIADAKTLGLKENQYTDNHSDFAGFTNTKVPPQITKITASSANLIEVVFSENLKPSSISSTGRDFSIYTSEAKPKRLGINHVEFIDGQTLRISTDKQGANQRYYLRVGTSIVSAAGIKVGGNTKKTTTEYSGVQKAFVGFKGLKSIDNQTVVDAADFDRNGKIDFTDFSIFSSIYGQNLNNNSASNTDTPSVSGDTTPLNNDPNATIPSTSPVNE